MKKIYKLEDLDCAVCASKMESAINKIAGVNSATVDFIGQRLIIDASDENFTEIMQEAKKCIKKVDSECEIIGL